MLRKSTPLSILEEARTFKTLVLISIDLLSGTFATVSKYVTIENIYNNAYSLRQLIFDLKAACILQVSC